MISKNKERALSLSNGVIHFDRLVVFRLFTLIVVIEQFPLIIVPIHGFYGYGVLIVAVYILIFGGSNAKRVTQNLRSNMIHNRWLLILLLWYIGGVVFNTLIRGNGLYDWIWWIYPTLMLILLGYGLLFLNEKKCLRYFQICFAIIIGIQCLFTSIYMLRFPDTARLSVNSGWIYGSQSNYTIYAMALPVLIWRSLHEKKNLRIILLSSCSFIFLNTLISGFATPLGLVIGGILASISLFIFLPIKNMRRRSCVGPLIISIVLIGGSILIYQNTKGLPYFTGAYSRITNVIKNPQSGGYDKQSAVTGSRWTLAEKSVTLFLSNPLFGDGGSPRYNPKSGGHSSFFDTLACFGILGGGGAIFGVVVFIILRAIKRYRIKRDWETLAGLISTLMLFAAGVVDPYWEFDAIPIIILLTGILIFQVSTPLEKNEKIRRENNSDSRLIKYKKSASST
jgi:hypothetical protein